MSLIIKNLNFSYSDKHVLKNISLSHLPKGQLTVLLGPNAAGKSTFFRSLAGLIEADYEHISINDKKLNELSAAERSQRVCYMPQIFSTHAMLTVFEVVLLAQKELTSWSVSGDDIEAVESLLKQFEIDHLAQRYISELSGGQQQLVSICQAMARSAELFLLDEPTSALDLRHQLKVMQRLKDETQQRNVTTIIALHDLGLAARFADNLLLMKDGKLVGHGETEAMFASPLIEDIYGIEIELFRNAKGSLVVASELK
ncbi:MAG: iron ABC transporter ATP-binding protein [Gammaproteobacteria bacterium]|nr:MAG: iron ABC transporter ATP-binding protein [Gammaproteobacteria bacterium]